MGDILLAERREPPGVSGPLVPDGSRRTAKVDGIGRWLVDLQGYAE